MHAEEDSMHSRSCNYIDALDFDCVGQCLSTDQHAMFDCPWLPREQSEKAFLNRALIVLICGLLTFGY